MLGLVFLSASVCHLSNIIFTNRQITIVTTEKLLNEIEEVTSRERLKKYFPKKRIIELLELLETIAEKVEIKSTHFINRDPKDNFLFY